MPHLLNAIFEISLEKTNKQTKRVWSSGSWEIYGIFINIDKHGILATTCDARHASISLADNTIFSHQISKKY